MKVKNKATLIPYILLDIDKLFGRLIYLHKGSNEEKRAKEHPDRYIPADLPHTTYYAEQEEYVKPPEDEL